jgi:serine/threonine protein kinase
MLYTMLTGCPPFVGKTLPETLLKVVRDLPISPTTLKPGVAADLANICMKCLKKAPERRYASARELAEDLQRFRAQEPCHLAPADHQVCTYLGE